MPDDTPPPAPRPLLVTRTVLRTAAAALWFVALATSGCIGAGTLTTYREVQDASTWVRTTADGSPGRLPRALTESANALRARRGEPDDVEVVGDGVEEWTYDEGMRLGGVVLFVVVMIPLAVPIGTEHVIYTIEDGAVTRTEYVRQHWSGGACGLVGHRFGCDSWDVID